VFHPAPLICRVAVGLAIRYSPGVRTLMPDHTGFLSIYPPFPTTGVAMATVFIAR